MNYDLSIKENRKRFVTRANKLLKNQSTLVCLEDRSNRTLEQNAYIHVLFRIIADYTGDTEEYVKQVHFKQLANPDIFVTVTKDPISGKMVKYIKSSANISVNEMSKAIDNFIKWAAEYNIELPQATINPAGGMTFKTQQDEQAFHQAEIVTSKD